MTYYMMQPVKVSVIMPAYNRETYIRESIDSVLAQSFTDFELIVVDDGSTDATAAIVESYTDRRIRLIRQSNRGVSVARNTGLEAARGQFITFLDSDDLYYPDFLNTLFRLIRSTKTDMVFCDFSESYQAEDMKIINLRKIRCFIKEKLLGTRVLTSDSLIDGLPTNIDCVMISKNLIERYHLRFLPGVRMFEDWNFLYKAFLAAKKICGTYRCLAHYRRHSDSASFIQYSSPEEATPVDLRENELEFAQHYGLNGGFIKRVKRYEVFKTFKLLIRQKDYKKAARHAENHKTALTCYAKTGERWNDRLYCRVWRFVVKYMEG